jgi:hypothetical protein
VQHRARRAFIGSGLEVMTTVEIARWTHPQGTSRRNAYRHLRDVLERYAKRCGRSPGRPILWRLRDEERWKWRSKYAKRLPD